MNIEEYKKLGLENIKEVCNLIFTPNFIQADKDLIHRINEQASYLEGLDKDGNYLYTEWVDGGFWKKDKNGNRIDFYAGKWELNGERAKLKTNKDPKKDKITIEDLELI